eukprot:Nk52_evm80s2367 gene=Nk52_evmTU80s2367
MFYSQFVLAKKGPLGRIWLAAHWDRKLTKAQIFQTDIQGSVDSIIDPQVPIALRTSGHLLLGVTRIYSRKAKYLLADASDALVKIKCAFRPGTVDLPSDGATAQFAAITLAENAQDVDLTMEGIEIEDYDEDVYNQNVSRPEDITLPDDRFHMDFGVDKIQLEGFGEENEDHFLVFDGVVGGGEDDSVEVEVARAGPALDPANESYEPAAELGAGNKNDATVVSEADISLATTTKEGELMGDASMMMDNTMEKGAAGDEMMPMMVNEEGGFGGDSFGDGFGDENAFGDGENPFENNDASMMDIEVNVTAENGGEKAGGEQIVPEAEDNFTLEPLMPVGSASGRGAKEAKADKKTVHQRSNAASRKKRKLVIDELIAIPSDEIKKQLKNTDDIVDDDVRYAPPKKRVVTYKDIELKGPEYFFSKSSNLHLSKVNAALFEKHLVAGRPDYPKKTPVEVVPVPAVPLKENDNNSRGDIGFGGDDETIHEAEPELEPLQEEEIPNETEVDFGGDNNDYSGFGGDSYDNPPVGEEGGWGTEDGAELGDETKAAEEQEEETVRKENVPDEDFMFSQTADQMQDYRAGDKAQDDKGYSKRTYKMFRNLRTAFETSDTISYNTITEKKDRRTASACLFELLVLKTREYIDVNQSEPFGDIEVTTEEKFYNDPLVAAPAN